MTKSEIVDYINNTNTTWQDQYTTGEFVVFVKWGITLSVSDKMVMGLGRFFYHNEDSEIRALVDTISQM